MEIMRLKETHLGHRVKPDFRFCGLAAQRTSACFQSSTRTEVLA